MIALGHGWQLNDEFDRRVSGRDRRSAAADAMS